MSQLAAAEKAHRAPRPRLAFPNGLRPSLALIPTFDEKGRALVVIETPQGSPNKMKYEAAYGAFRLTQVLPAGSAFPYDFGFLPGTCAPDRDPLDVLVLMESALPPGSIVPARLVGVLEAEQREADGPWTRNDRIIAVADCSRTQGSIHALADLSPPLLDEIEAFFIEYNRLAEKDFRILGRRGPRRAERLVAACLHDP